MKPQPPIDTPARFIANLDARATKHATPCGLGHMRWREWGAGTPLVLLHGGFGSWLHWIRNIESLSQSFRVIAADLPGLGESDLPVDPVTPEGIGSIVSEGLRAVVGAASSLHVVGFSFGGLIAGQVCLALGERVRSLTLVGASGLGLRRPPLKLMRREEGMDATAREAAHRYNLRALMLHRDESMDALALHVHAQNDRHARLRSRRMSLGDSLKKALPNVPARVHGIWGEHDATAGPYLRDREALLRETHPECEFRIIRGAGHWVQFEGYEEFDGVLRSWVNGEW